jgi:hypothetical protein
MRMTADQIRAELAVLEERIAQAPASIMHALDLKQLEQAKLRRDLLLGELKRLRRIDLGMEKLGTRPTD